MGVWEQNVGTPPYLPFPQALHSAAGAGMSEGVFRSDQSTLGPSVNVPSAQGGKKEGIETLCLEQSSAEAFRKQGRIFLGVLVAHSLF